jgi:enoyl-CoA hydratase/carnithine racemase
LLVNPAEAFRVGLVDEVVPVSEVIPRAIAWMTDLLSRPAVAMVNTRAMARRPLREAFDSLTPAVVQSLVAEWFSAETQTVMRSLADRLGRRDKDKGSI